VSTWRSGSGGRGSELISPTFHAFPFPFLSFPKKQISDAVMATRAPQVNPSAMVTRAPQVSPSHGDTSAGISPSVMATRAPELALLPRRHERLKSILVMATRAPESVPLSWRHERRSQPFYHGDTSTGVSPAATHLGPVHLVLLASRNPLCHR